MNLVREPQNILHEENINSLKGRHRKFHKHNLLLAIDGTTREKLMKI